MSKESDAELLKTPRERDVERSRERSRCAENFRLSHNGKVVPGVNDPAALSALCYKVLQLEQGSVFDHVRTKYTSLALQLHPDRSGGNEEEFVKIGYAYSYLKFLHDDADQTQSDLTEEWRVLGTALLTQAIENERQVALGQAELNKSLQFVKNLLQPEATEQDTQLGLAPSATTPPTFSEQQLRILKNIHKLVNRHRVTIEDDFYNDRLLQNKTPEDIALLGSIVQNDFLGDIVSNLRGSTVLQVYKKNISLASGLAAGKESLADIMEIYRWAQAKCHSPLLERMRQHNAPALTCEAKFFIIMYDSGLELKRECTEDASSALVPCNATAGAYYNDDYAARVQHEVSECVALHSKLTQKSPGTNAQDPAEFLSAEMKKQLRYDALQLFLQDIFEAPLGWHAELDKVLVSVQYTDFFSSPGSGRCGFEIHKDLLGPIRDVKARLVAERQRELQVLSSQLASLQQKINKLVDQNNGQRADFPEILALAKRMAELYTNNQQTVCKKKLDQLNVISDALVNEIFYPWAQTLIHSRIERARKSLDACVPTEADLRIELVQKLTVRMDKFAKQKEIAGYRNGFAGFCKKAAGAMCGLMISLTGVGLFLWTSGTFRAEFKEYFFTSKTRAVIRSGERALNRWLIPHMTSAAQNNSPSPIAHCLLTPLNAWWTALLPAVREQQSALSEQFNSLVQTLTRLALAASEVAKHSGEASMTRFFSGDKFAKKRLLAHYVEKCQEALQEVKNFRAQIIDEALGLNIDGIILAAEKREFFKSPAQAQTETASVSIVERSVEGNTKSVRSATQSPSESPSGADNNLSFYGGGPFGGYYPCP